MPVTPLHYWPAYLLKKIYPRLDMFSLISGAFIPDIEVLFFIMLNSSIDRLILHSLFGVIFFVPIIGLIVIIPFFKLIKREYNLRILAMSLSIGGITHVLLDLFTHSMNPLLFPFSNESIYYFFFGTQSLSTTFVYLFSALFMLGIVIFEYKNRKDIYRTFQYLLFGD